MASAERALACPHRPNRRLDGGLVTRRQCTTVAAGQVFNDVHGVRSAPPSIAGEGQGLSNTIPQSSVASRPVAGRRERPLRGGPNPKFSQEPELALVRD